MTTAVTAPQYDRRLVIPAPERSLIQRRAALDYANEVRTTRAALKRDVLKHDPQWVTLIDLVEFEKTPPVGELRHYATMKVIDLLLAARGIGTVKAGKLLKRCQISPSKTLAGLSRRQRAELVLELRTVRLIAARAPGWRRDGGPDVAPSLGRFVR